MALLTLSPPRRPRRTCEWTDAKAVTFIVTLAASRSVTVAAARVGMSRKAAYALRNRDGAFAMGWDAALAAGARRVRRQLPLRPAQGNKVTGGYDPPIRDRPGGKKTPRRVPAGANPFAEMDIETICAILRDSDRSSLARDILVP